MSNKVQVKKDYFPECSVNAHIATLFYNQGVSITHLIQGIENG